MFRKKKPFGHLAFFEGDSTLPVKIQISGDRDNISSYSASVEVWQLNNRKSSETYLAQKYNLSMKEIGGEIYTRMDFPEDETGALSSVANQRELVFFDRVSEKVLERQAIETSPSTRLFSGLENRLSLQARVPDFARFMSRLRAASLDITEDSETELSTVDLTSLGQQDNPNISSFTIRLDTADEVWVETEIIEVMEDGSTEHSSTTPLYIEDGTNFLVIGSVTETVHDFAHSIDTTGNMLPPIDEAEAVEEVSAEEIVLMQEEGYEVYDFDEPLGDPSDPDYISTELSIMQEIELNEVDDSAFRLLLN